MFTGIIEEKGLIRNFDINGSSGRTIINCRKVLEGTKTGDSIAVNGICLTVTELHEDAFAADVMAETVRRSSLSRARPGDPVNLERAMAANGRFGGHIVSGHIDGTGVVRDIRKEENAVWFSIGATASILKYVIEKGSIAIDGISLTVAYVGEEIFKVSVIPHTLRETALASKKVGSPVNLECDVIGKYVGKLLGMKTGNLNKQNEERNVSETKWVDETNGITGYAGSSNGGMTMEFLETYL
ncbi:riboflavin synthase alpha chain [Oribacterium sp. KHPX15]|uniref:riboflavin synthase n=1 Tax=Oribacterium sp. KHPX15 TaxID=1855342 RepID=UPI000897EDB1|nr:riboflavin synthase [Oribacterium sp. KHPX15]SEA75078.1 riboflavin synthase alpha chain [Oribacterium sp. KHPX15]